jgi:hypothetical protein
VSGALAGCQNPRTKFWASTPKTLPEAKEYTGQLEARFSPVSLRGKTMQCIIRPANIHLTPEQPEYEGGSWHVEGTIQIRSCCISPLRACIGMVNESIVASGIYVRRFFFVTYTLFVELVQYYDEETFSESKLSFRVSVGEPDYHGQDDNQDNLTA